MTFSDLENYINQHFLVADRGIVRLICATVIANRLQGDPVWLFVIAPSSGLKSEIIRALDGVTGIYPLSSLTPRTLISGQRASTGEETSLLKKMLPSSIFTFKDLTTVLQMNHTDRDAILGQLREVYDGQFRKSFGNGLDVDWQGKVGFISGVTEAVDIYQGMYSILGERFLQYRMKQPNRKEATEAGIKNASKIMEIRKQAATLFKDYLDNLTIPVSAPELAQDWIKEIVDLSEFATLARSGNVIRDSKTHEIEHRFSPEMPIRFAKQIQLLAEAFTVMGQEPDDRNILRKIAISSLPKNRIEIIKVLIKENLEPNQASDEEDKNVEVIEIVEDPNEWTTRDVGLALRASTSYARRHLQDLESLEIATRRKGKNDIWQINEGYKSFFEKYFPDGFNL